MNEHGSWTFWLMLTNLALAAVVLGSVLVVVLGVVWEFLKPGTRTGTRPSSIEENEAALPPEMNNIDEELAAMLREEARRILAEESRPVMVDAREAVAAPKNKLDDTFRRK